MRGCERKAKGADNKKGVVSDCCDSKNKRDHDKEIVWSEVDKLVKDLRKTAFLQKFRL